VLTKQTGVYQAKVTIPLEVHWLCLYKCSLLFTANTEHCPPLKAMRQLVQVQRNSIVILS